MMLYSKQIMWRHSSSAFMFLSGVNCTKIVDGYTMCREVCLVFMFYLRYLLPTKPERKLGMSILALSKRRPEQKKSHDLVFRAVLRILKCISEVCSPSSLYEFSWFLEAI